MDNKKEEKMEQKKETSPAAPGATENMSSTEQKAAEAEQKVSAEADRPEKGTTKASAEEKPVSAEADRPEKDAEKPAEPPPPPPIDWKDRYARTMADFDNYRKRVARDREDLVKAAGADVIKDVLATVDNLALALEKAKGKADDPFVKGVQLVYDGLLKTLAQHGAAPLDVVGEPFDANFHEALQQMPSADVAEGSILYEAQRGWLLHGKLLRPAKVVVSSGKPA